MLCLVDFVSTSEELTIQLIVQIDNPKQDGQANSPTTQWLQRYHA